jgi:hypothetical protein
MFGTAWQTSVVNQTVCDSHHFGNKNDRADAPAGQKSK